MNIVDLHTHSNKSDGSFSPAELVDYAVEKGLSAIALTDHDAVEGIEEALREAEGKGIEVIPGIEFSSEYEGQDIHIVGLYIDHRSDYFRNRLVHFVNGRKLRNEEMCRRLTAMGMPIDYEELVKKYPGSVITRGHMARYLLEQGYTKSIKEAFDRYIGDGKPCFVPRKKISPMRAVEIVLKAGGFPILAHPLLYHMGRERLEELVIRLKEVGLQGLEAVYSTHTPSDERRMRELALKYDLCISGGSDFHGAAKPGLDLAVGYGRLFIPEEILDNIKSRRRWLKENSETVKMSKILFTDLDGTLLNDEKMISSRTREVLEAWSKAGHKLVLCSGRDINSVKSVKEYLQLDFPGMYLIGYNGGQIYDCDAEETIYKVMLTVPQIAHIMEEAEKFGLHCHTYTDTNIISPREDKELSYYQRVIKTPAIISRDVTHMLEEGACKCIVIELEEHEKQEAFRKSLLPWAKEEGISLVYSNPYYLELFPAVSGKGAAVVKLCEILKSSVWLSVAAGDAQNDLSMIEAAGTGIAMKNGCEEVKVAATMVTEQDNNHDGLAEAVAGLI